MDWKPSISQSYSFLEAVKKTIINNNMIFSGEKILVAVSGGSDSIALLYVLNFLSASYNIKLGIAHLDHKIRGFRSKKEALFVKSIAGYFNIPYYCSSADVMKVKKGLKLSIEEAARKIRYSFLKKISIKYSFSKIALAHHMDDNAELVLMFMMRGSGLDGLSGMLPVRSCFIRPFIKTNKASILKFLSDENILYVEDKSNMDLKFTRNRIRHSLIPILKKSFNPKIIANLNKMAVLINDENIYMKRIVHKEYKKTIINNKNNKKRITFSLPVFNKFDISIKRRIIRKAIFLISGSLKRISFSHIESVIKLTYNNSGYKTINLSSFIKVRKIYEILKIEKVFKQKYKSICPIQPHIFSHKLSGLKDLPLKLKNMNYEFKFSLINKNDLSSYNILDKNNAFFDLRFIKFPITIRYVKKGDKINPLGMKGSQKIRRYSSNKKIPLYERANILVVDDNGSIIWLVKHSICDYAKVTNGTEDVLMIKFCLLNAQ